MLVPSVSVTVCATVSTDTALTETTIPPLRVTLKLPGASEAEAATEASPVPNSLNDNTRLVPLTAAVFRVGAVVSSVSARVLDASETRLAALVSVAVRFLAPSLPRLDRTMSTLLAVTFAAVSTAVPTLMPFEYTSTTSPVVGEESTRCTVGVLFEVLRSLLSVPLSEAAGSVKVGALGVVRASVATTV